MPDLSAYLNFTIKLDKSGSTPAIVLTDTSTYPGGVAATVTGVYSITQPDGIAVTGTWDAISPVSAALRLAADDNFQNGIYPVTVTVTATGYTQTILTQSPTVTYTPVSLNIADLSDVFTPQLQLQDGTRYPVALFNAPTITRAWSADITYVTDAIQTVTGTAIVFDMAYGGIYYDAHYDVTFAATVTYTSNVYSYLTVKDKISEVLQADAYTPKTLTQLRSSLLTMKAQIKDGTYCGGGCGCESDLTPYTEAQAIYSTFLQNGQSGENLFELYDLQLQLQKYFNCSGIVTQTHTYEGIPDYDWGTPVPSMVNRNAIQFKVGSGATYAPANGASSYVNPTLQGYTGYLVFSSADGYYLTSNADFTYDTDGGFTFLNSRTFYTGDKYTLIFN